MAPKKNTSGSSSNSASRKPRRKLDIWNKIAVVILTLFLVACVSVFFILVNIINDPDGMRFTRDGLSTMSTSRIFDDSGNIVYEFGSEIREDVTYEQLPQSVVDAFLAIEDSRYFEHSGFDLPRFMAAGIANLESGGFSQGGSTLTMQMIDNNFTKNQERKMTEENGSIGKLDQIKLKIQEIYLSLIAEQTLSKEDILENYVNRVWFGSGNNTRGIQKAANYYFNKDVSDLNLGEAAFLAGAVNAPGLYNPIRNLTETDSSVDHLAAATERRNTTLYMMLQHGYITQEEYDLATATDLALALDYEEVVSVDPYQAYIDQVIEEAISLTGQDPTIIPMDIYTAMNADVQEEVDKIMNGEIINFPNDAFDVGLSITNNHTGEIIAVGPGRTYHNDTNKQDNSINTKQPGSSMKPLLAYCSTFDLLGWSTAHVVDDRADDYWHAGFNLRNSDGLYEGKISLAYALGVSKNTTAAATMVELVKNTGIPYWIDFCEKLGFNKEVCDRFNEQYSIGGSDMWASPVQMASAYSMFANGGVRINAHRIRQIIRRTDKEEISGNTTEYELISTQAAWMMSDLLRQVVTGGYHNYNNILGSPNYTVYAKSGTSDWGNVGLQYGIPQGVIRDEWSIGYTNAFSIATWSGYTEPYFTQGMYIDVGVLDQATAFHINKYLLDFMQQYGDYSAIPRPDGISDYNGGYIKSEFVNKGDASSGYVQNPNPQGDDVTTQEQQAAQNACVASGGSWDGAACTCPDGFELNGTSCQYIISNPMDSETTIDDPNSTPGQEQQPETPQVPDGSDTIITDPNLPVTDPNVPGSDPSAPIVDPNAPIYDPTIPIGAVHSWLREPLSWFSRLSF